ncbi:MAG: IS110 family transposase [Bacteroidia bacterium]|nr:IS110 family transposase [Bacteroidia bacterium]
MKNVKETVGIDVSKLTLDVFIHTLKDHAQFENNRRGYLKILKWLKSKQINLNEVLFCFEHTGWYCIILSYFLKENSIDYCCINPMEIKRSMGLKRGKSDKADSKEIAYYAWLRRSELAPSIPPAKNIIELQRMMSLREQFVKQQTALKNLRKGMEQITVKGQTDASIMALDDTLNHLEFQINRIEKAMDALIKLDQQLNKNYKLSKSVKGVGPILAIQMLLHTHNYSRFASWRQFSSYCGLVPFPYQSGTSIHGRDKSHPISDRKMKSLLSMSAISAIQHDKELKNYYSKRVEEGKPKMVVLNIIRNKIVARIFATVNRGTPFVPLSNFAA